MIKEISKILITSSKLYDALRILNRRKVIILMYHGFYDENNPEGLEIVANRWCGINQFKEQMHFIKVNYNVININELIEHYKEGKYIPDYPVIITLDDGYRSNYKLAYPFLQKCDIPFTVLLSTQFVNNLSFNWPDRLEYAIWNSNVECIDIKINNIRYCHNTNNLMQKISAINIIRECLKNEDLITRNISLKNIENISGSALNCENAPRLLQPLTWNDISDMIKSDLVTIGSHSVNHPNLTKCSTTDINTELIDSRNIIEDYTRQRCDVFGYPGGAYNEQVKDLTKKTGYKCALAINNKKNYLNHCDLFELKRISVNRAMNINDFIYKIL